MKDFFERHKKECLSSGLVVAVIVVLLVAAVPFYGKNKATENQKTAEKKTEKQEKVAADTEKLISYVKGIKDLYIEQNAKDIDWMKGITYDKQKVKEVTADSTAVKLDKTGKYDLVYHVSGKDGKKEDKSVVVSVVDSKKSQKLADSGKSVLLTKNELKQADNSKKTDTEKKDEKKETEVAKNENKTAENLSVESKSENNKAQSGNTAGSDSASGSGASGNSSSGTAGSSNQSSGATGSTSGSNQSGGTSSQPAPETPNTQPSQPEEKPTEPQKTWHEPVYEDRYVVDQAAWDEVIEEPVYEMVVHWYCNTCGADITSDPEGHVDETMHGGYRSDYVQEQTGTTTRTIHHDEVGHTERVLVQEGYWG